MYDAGDILRRDGACEQRGRFGRDDGRWDEPGEVFGACAGAALYRRGAVFEVGGFDERYFAYLEDVDLALRLRLAGWRCRYEPAVALHAGEGSSPQLAGGHPDWSTRNTIVLVAKIFPARWLRLVGYRQLGWACARAPRRDCASALGASACRSARRCAPVAGCARAAGAVRQVVRRGRSADPPRAAIARATLGQLPERGVRRRVAVRRRLVEGSPGLNRIRL